MAGWITHCMIVDRLYSKGLELDERGFTVGSIAPDCNVENEDWTSFTPSREVTHWMDGKSKLTADFEGFYREFIEGGVFISREHEAFLWGYYAHLVVDVEFTRFVRDEKRVRDCFDRIRRDEGLYAAVRGMPEDWDTVKRAFGKRRLFGGGVLSGDLAVQEIECLRENPASRWFSVLKEVREFPDYLAYLPQGAVVRKIGIMAVENMSLRTDGEMVFFSREEFEGFVCRTCGMIYDIICERTNKEIAP